MKIVNVERYKTETYHVKFDRYFGWAVFFVDESTGVVAIESDWGCFAYRWSSPGGPLKEFLASADPHYMTEKFSYHRNHKDFDSEATVQHMHEVIIERRKDEEITKEEARDAWHEIENELYIDYSGSETLFIERMSPSTHDVLRGEPWDCIEREYTPRFKTLEKQVIPAFQDLLKKELANAQAA